ncbi:hypothetical protein PVAND_016177 [Polypedilum vanderplanki]|uniref:Uncharacterized protein n=1 Tax=Polypedilum vanderplanki TaxID=319348 RepID=A0A9J6BEP3_POLVA|nr:hypothetical protein PVAND_016177 [Polypedilum vanderplanki]
MPKDKGIIEEATETIIVVKEAAKETVQNVAETVKKVLTGDTEQIDPSKRIVKEKTEEIKNAAEEIYEEALKTGKSPEEIAREKFEKAKEHAEKTAEEVKEKLKTPKGELNPSKEEENFKRNKFYAFESAQLIAPQRTVFESILEPSRSIKIFPAILVNLKKVLK